MKKAYQKPEIMFESFAASMNIALGVDCSEQNSLPTYNYCGFDWGGDVIFLVGNTGCGDEPYTSDDINNGICYHNPADYARLFNS